MESNYQEKTITMNKQTLNLKLNLKLDVNKDVNDKGRKLKNEARIT